GRAVEGDDVALVQHPVADGQGPGLDVDLAATGAGHAGLAHAARDDGRVRGHAAVRGQDALGDDDTVDVVGCGLVAHQHHGLTLAAALGGGVGVEHDLTDGGARGRG